MTYNISKQKVFDFLKAESIVEEIEVNSLFEIIESKIESQNGLNKVILKMNNSDSKFWKVHLENSTGASRFLEPIGKKVDSIILQELGDTLNIILIELKSKTIKESDIKEKFEMSLSWIYLLLNLLNNKENQKIKVFGILIAQKNKKWNQKDTLNIFNSTSIRYLKRSFHTTSTEIELNFQDFIAAI